MDFFFGPPRIHRIVLRTRIVTATEMFAVRGVYVRNRESPLRLVVLLRRLVVEVRHLGTSNCSCGELLAHRGLRHDKIRPLPLGESFEAGHGEFQQYRPRVAEQLEGRRPRTNLAGFLFGESKVSLGSQQERLRKVG